MPPSSAGLTPKGGVVNNRRRAMAFSRTLQWDQPAPTQPIRAVTLRASTHQLRIFARDPQGSHGPTLTGYPLERPERCEVELSTRSVDWLHIGWLQQTDGGSKTYSG